MFDQPIRHHYINGVIEPAIGAALALLPEDWWLCDRCGNISRRLREPEIAAFWCGLADVHLAERAMEFSELLAAAQVLFLRPFERNYEDTCTCSRRGPRPPKTGGFWIYILWGEAGRLLYVGQTRNAKARFTNHKTRPGWGELIRAVTWMECMDAADMVNDEAVMIAQFNPPLNSQGTT